jgi:TnpA family transposase
MVALLAHGMEQFDSIEHLFSTPVNWQRIEKHYPDFMRLALAIHSGKLAPSAVLARINSRSSRDSFSLALQELGNVVRTTFLLRWTWDEALRREVHKGTTKVERSHQFAKYLNFGGEGGLKTNSPADQEKAIVYNELVANAVSLQPGRSSANRQHRAEAIDDFFARGFNAAVARARSFFRRIAPRSRSIGI